MAWTEKEVRAAVAAYFELLDAQERGESPNKTALYRQLARRFPDRSPGAFERKFGNISAVLYELRLPYADGLKPYANYQNLLKLIVLDHLHQSPQPDLEPHEILFGRLRTIQRRGPIPVTHAGSGRYGLAVEQALRIPQNSDRGADFMGIELKTKADRSLQTLFSRVPSRYVDVKDMRDLFTQYSYKTGGTRRLNTSISRSGDSLGFRLRPGQDTVQVVRDSRILMEYDAELLEEALLSKLMQTAFIRVKPSSDAGPASCTLDEAVFCKWPSILRFLKLIDEGYVHLDLLLSERGGRVTSRGFLWRLKSEAIAHLFLFSESVDLG